MTCAPIYLAGQWDINLRVRWNIFGNHPSNYQLLKDKQESKVLCQLPSPL